jgi:hypothetical protein
MWTKLEPCWPDSACRRDCTGRGLRFRRRKPPSGPGTELRAPHLAERRVFLQHIPHTMSQPRFPLSGTPGSVWLGRPPPFSGRQTSVSDVSGPEFQHGVVSVGSRGATQRSAMSAALRSRGSPATADAAVGFADSARTASRPHVLRATHLSERCPGTRGSRLNARPAEPWATDGGFRCLEPEFPAVRPAG